MVKKTRTDFKSITASLYPDNNTGEISAADVRVQMDNIADSASFSVTATRAPIATDSNNNIGDNWIDSVNDITYVCVDNTVNNAVWQKLLSPADVSISFATEAAMLAATDLVADQRAQPARGDQWVVKPLGFLPTSPTVKNGAAFQFVSTSLTQDCTFSEDTRTITFLRSLYDTTGFIFATYAGHRYQLDLTQAGTGDVTTAGGVKLSVLPVAGQFNVAAFGASAAKTAAQNNAIISTVLAKYGTCVIPKGVVYDKATYSPNVGGLIFDGEGKEIVIGGSVLKGGDRANYFTITNTQDSAGPSIYIEPPSWLNGAQVAVKLFREPYTKNLKLGGEDTATYRDVGLTIEAAGGHNGAGSIKLNAQGGGHMGPFGPDFHIGTFKNSAFRPFRILWAQGNALPAGTYFPGGVAQFEGDKIAWRAGMTVTQGNLLTQGTGRVYEVLNTGTTGTVRPVHATYNMWQATVPSTVGYLVGEVVNEGLGVAFPRGTIQAIPDANTLVMAFPNSNLAAGNFNVGATLTGMTSGISQVISASGRVVFDYDFSPTGGPFQQVDAPAVPGRTVSDGGVNLRFLDDVTGGNTDNNQFYPITVFGDEDSQPVFFDPETRIQFLDYKTLMRDGALTLENYPLTQKGVGVENVMQETASGQLWSTSIINGSGDRHMKNGAGKGRIIYSSLLAERHEGIAPAVSPITDTSNSAVIDVTGKGVILVNFSPAINVTGLTGGIIGQSVELHFQNANVTLVESVNSFELKGTGNIAVASKRSATFRKISGSVWRMTGGTI